MDLDPVLLERQLAESRADLRAFHGARELMRRRYNEVRDDPWPEALLPRITEWTGYTAVSSSMELAIHAMERTILELEQLLKATKTGRKFRVVTGEEDGSES